MVVTLSLFVSLRLCSFPGARRQWEALEASVSGFDRERPLNIWEHATDEGSLVQPCAHLPPARHQVPLLFYHGSFQEQREQLSQPGMGIVIHGCSHTWNVVVGEAGSSSVGWCAELNSSLLHFKYWLRLSTRNSLGFWMWPLGLDTEAGVLKKLRVQSSEIPISVYRPVNLAERLWLPAAPPGWKKVILLLWVERSGMAVLHH